MAIRKTTKKTTGKKASARKAASPKTEARKTPARKAPRAKREADAPKPETRTARDAKAAGGKKPTVAAKPAIAPAKAGGSVSSRSVNLGHVFALRPRVSTTFRQEAFIAARRYLEAEEYATLEEAARAVAERALETTNDNQGKRGFKARR